MQPFILSLKFDEETFLRLDELRRRHFPPARNFIPAHLTLFHALPGEREDFIKQTLTEIAAATAVLELEFPNLRFLGKGTAIEVNCSPLVELRQKLSNTFREFLTAQDSHRIKPHVTIQNKVAPDTAKQLFSELAQIWQPFNGCGEGLLLWRYLPTGRWEFVREFVFRETLAQ